MNTIFKEQQRICDNIKKWHDKLEQLQENCPHENAKIEYGGNTGNYDPSSNVYWKKYNCPDCGKTWTKYKNPTFDKEYK